MQSAAAATIVRLRKNEPIMLDDGPEATAFIATEIRISNLTYQQIAERSGVGANTIGKIACGDTKLPRWMTLVRIARVLGWSIYASRH